MNMFGHWKRFRRRMRINSIEFWMGAVYLTPVLLGMVLIADRLLSGESLTLRICTAVETEPVNSLVQNMRHFRAIADVSHDNKDRRLTLRFRSGLAMSTRELSKSILPEGYSVDRSAVLHYGCCTATKAGGISNN